MLVFAYGSLLALELMAELCPGARAIQQARLPGYRVAFPVYSARRGGGISSILPDAAGVARGVLYEVSPGELERLDDFEGVPTNFYRRVQRRVDGADGKPYDAELYEVVERGPEIAPATSYINDMLRGACAHGFDAEYLRWLESLRR